MKTATKHLEAIASGRVSKTNIIGLRKVINAEARRALGYSTSRTAPNMGRAELDHVLFELKNKEPKVVGELHASGVKVLQSPLHKKHFSKVAGIVASIAAFRLVRFDWIGGLKSTPVYRAVSKTGESFLFRNVSWQSGGKGPEVL